jgi:hypothetical protein
MQKDYIAKGRENKLEFNGNSWGKIRKTHNIDRGFILSNWLILLLIEALIC